MRGAWRLRLCWSRGWDIVDHLGGLLQLAGDGALVVRVVRVHTLLLLLLVVRVGGSRGTWQRSWSWSWSLSWS